MPVLETLRSDSEEDDEDEEDEEEEEEFDSDGEDGEEAAMSSQSSGHRYPSRSKNSSSSSSRSTRLTRTRAGAERKRSGKNLLLLLFHQPGCTLNLLRVSFSREQSRGERPQWQIVTQRPALPAGLGRSVVSGAGRRRRHAAPAQEKDGESGREQDQAPGGVGRGFRGGEAADEEQQPPAAHGEERQAHSCDPEQLGVGPGAVDAE